MWKEEKLSNLSTLITKGATPTTSGHDYVHSLTEGGARFVRGNNATISGKFKGSDVKYICNKANEQLKRSKLKVGDIVISIVGSVGSSFQVDKRIIPANINQNVALIRPSNDLNSDYLGQVIVSEIVQDIIATELTVQAQPSLSLKQIGDFTIPFPPLPEQQKIAQILTSVDEVIEKTQAQIDKIKDLKTAMMQELLTKGIGHVEFKDSPVGRIPVGWEVKQLSETFDLSSGSTPSRREPHYFSTAQDAIPWIKTLDMHDGLITTTDEKITKLAIENSSCKLLPIGTAIVAMYGGWNQIGRSGVLAIEATTNQAICALKPIGLISGEFVNYWLISKRNIWKSVAASSRKDPNITKQDVSDFLVVVPSIKEQREIVARLDSLTCQVDNKKKLLVRYQAIKKALMQDLLTGKVRVKVS
jgi:type I restriction enzyme S subunit